MGVGQHLLRREDGSLPCILVTMGQGVILSGDRCTDRAELAQPVKTTVLSSTQDYAVRKNMSLLF